ncbi:hypothetical protein OCV99_14405 [Dorea acetigenes]|uniref:DUF1648 domain-containing protein n=1 Tax=Dorea acetigenes TaxID=2981787 RepID=A0ABT2RQK0_9FIRM|nr:hypothetical protein [Dorea acetigenes]MCU6687700.1 hypothetical protein [Dorea acetigenes]
MPGIIPVHFTNGIADDFGSKIKIFLFHVLLLIITIICYLCFVCIEN